MKPLPSDLFARRVRQERTRQGMSQTALAMRISTTLGTKLDATAITRIEQQTRAVRLDEAVATAEALGLPLVFFTNDDPVFENEAEMQRQLIELNLAEQEAERCRTRIEQHSRAIQSLSTERRTLLTRLDPGLRYQSTSATQQ